MRWVLKSWRQMTMSASRVTSRNSAAVASRERAGETAKFRFQLDGKPLPNFPFSLIPGNVKYRGTLNETRLTTDAKGEASFKLPEPNMYWLSAAYPATAPRGPGVEQPAKRYSYSATLDVLPE